MPSETVYKPYSPAEKLKAEQIIKQIPPYHDEGVKYSRYYKFPQGNSEYSLKPQQKFNLSDYFTFGAGSGGLIIAVNEIKNKNFYLQELDIVLFTAAATNMYVKNSSGVPIRTISTLAGENKHFHFTFETPVLMNHSTTTFILFDYDGSTSTAGDIVCFGVSGFIE